MGDGILYHSMRNATPKGARIPPLLTANKRIVLGRGASKNTLTLTLGTACCFDKRPRLGHIGYMSAIAKSRIDPELKRQAEAVLEEIGLKPRAALELFYKQIIKRRAIPFPVQADSPEDEVLSPAARRNELADEF